MNSKYIIKQQLNIFKSFLMTQGKIYEISLYKIKQMLNIRA